jgi:hypothetical protein
MAKPRPSAPSPALSLLCLTVAACGGTAVTGPPTPRLIEGGGLGDGPIMGGLNVHVTDDDTRAPVSGATVRVGGSSDPSACTATTDSTGLAIFVAKTCMLLNGKQSITASAADYAPSTWIGVDAANVTMAIRAKKTAPLDSAVVTGSIAGWDTLPAPAAGHQTLAIVGYSAGVHASDAVNNLQQDTRVVHVKIDAFEADVPIPSNLCVRNAGVNDCNWKLKTRTGKQAHYAVVFDQDQKGTPEDDKDDTLTVIGWAIKRGLAFSKDLGADGEALTLLTDTEMQSFSATFPSPPSGLDHIAAFPILTLGDEGRIAIIAPALNQMNGTTKVPKLAGPFADAAYDFLAKAQDAQDKDQPGTLTWAHAVDPTKPVAAMGWVAPPTNLKVMDGVYSFTPAAGASVSGAELASMDGRRAWSVTIFDGTTSFTLPGVSPDPLAAGPALFSASGLVIPGFKASDARFDDLAQKLTAIANDQIMFTH